jgi:hypothetical protein
VAVLASLVRLQATMSAIFNQTEECPPTEKNDGNEANDGGNTIDIHKYLLSRNHPMRFFTYLNCLLCTIALSTYYCWPQIARTERKVTN